MPTAVGEKISLNHVSLPVAFPFSLFAFLTNTVAWSLRLTTLLPIATHEIPLRAMRGAHIVDV